MLNAVVENDIQQGVKPETNQVKVILRKGRSWAGRTTPIECNITKASASYPYPFSTPLHSRPPENLTLICLSMNLPEDKLSFAPSYLQCNINNAQLWQVNNTQVQYWLFLFPLRLVSCPLAWCCSHNVRVSLKEVPQTKKIGKVAGCGTKEKSFQLKLRRMATENSITRFHGVSIVSSYDINAGSRKVSRRFLYFTN